MGPGKAQQATNLWDSEAAGLGLWKFVTSFASAWARSGGGSKSVWAHSSAYMRL